MNHQIPNSVIGAVASVIADHYYSHSKLDTLFMESGASGDVPEGNCEKKCSNWLKRCNKVTEGQARINASLAKNQLVYRTNGYVTKAGSTPITKTLEDYLRSGDFSSIEKEFERAIEHIQTDPHASVTASCSIIEATLKFYIESFDDLDMPNKLNVMPLWGVVQPHLALNADDTLAADQHKVLKGISSIIDSVGAFRSHIGSAHGRGSNPPSIVVPEARLVVNAAHTLVVFIMEVLHAKKA